MSIAMKRYQAWLENPAVDAESRKELEAIREDAAEIADRFYQELQFGTAGLRGVLGAGSNRMNMYTLCRAAEGFAQYYLDQGEAFCKRGLAISYDSRLFSPEFAELTARVFIGHGIRVYLVDELRPVPVLSYAIRHYDCAGGVMITASHNPQQYNGFKVYGEDGGQLPPDAAAIVAERMEEVVDAPACYQQVISREEALASDLLVMLGEDLDQSYTEMLLALSISPEAVARHQDLTIVYSPLHGSGNKPVRRVLKALGFRKVLVVPEQEAPDGHFPTCPYPNPESREALRMGIDLAEEAKADLLIATDPDADRMGVAVRTSTGEFVVLSGNEIGLLLLEYILDAKAKAGKLPERSFCVSTVVSTKLSQRICEAYAVKLYKVLTGFKFIAEKILAHDEEGDEHFQFGFEESFGYLAGKDVRDKDAVVASMLIAEMAAESADHGETLYDRLQKIFARYGYAAEKTLAIESKGKVGLEKIAKAMEVLFSKKLELFADLGVTEVCDYLEGCCHDLQTGNCTPFDMAESKVLTFALSGLDWFAVRPSGTEPKLKIYGGAYDEDKEKAKARLERIMSRASEVIMDLMEG